jgi:hypothetical protein
MTLEPGPGGNLRYTIAEADTARLTGRTAFQAVEEWIAMTKVYTRAITRGEPQEASRIVRAHNCGAYG